jgi:hypothetical protein
VRTCYRCSDRACALAGLPFGTGACPEWRPRWGLRVLEWVAVAVFIIFLALIVLGAIGDEWARQERERGQEIRTHEVLVIPRPLAERGPNAFMQYVDANTYCVVGAQQQAVWRAAGTVVEVPTQWVTTTASAAFMRVKMALAEWVVLRGIAG